MRDTTQKVQMLFRRARTDAEYAELSRDYRELEEWFSKRVQELPVEEQDRIWAFVCTSDAMNWRMLELIVEGKI